MVMVCWFSSFRRNFDLVQRVIFGVSGHFLENAWREWPEDWILVTVCLFSSIWCHSDLVKQVKLGISGISWKKTHWENGLKCCMLMDHDHLLNWLNYGHGTLIPFLTPLSFSETVQIWGFWAFPGTRMKGMAWDFCMLAYPDYLQNWLDYCYVLLTVLL